MLEIFVEFAKPLTNLTKKKMYLLNGRINRLFQKRNEILSIEPFLMYPDFTQPFIVACDASTKALGALLSQLWNGGSKGKLHTVVDRVTASVV
jgi:hypothetical protein